MSVRKVLVPIDFSDCSPEVVRRGAEIARAFGARMEILHVLRRPASVPADAPLPASEPGGSPSSVGAHLSQDAEARMPAYLDEARESGVTVTSVIREGPVADVILESCDQLSADMIVMGTHGRRGLARVVQGSVAEVVVRRARVPVVTVRTEHGPTCAAKSCNWCSAGLSGAEQDVDAEQFG